MTGSEELERLRAATESARDRVSGTTPPASLAKSDAFAVASERMRSIVLRKSPSESPERVLGDSVRSGAGVDRETASRLREFGRACGDRYAAATLDTFACSLPAQREIVDGLRQWVTLDPLPSLLIYGPVGTGKDHLAVAVCRSLIGQGKTVKRINGPEWFGELRDNIDRDRLEADALRPLVAPDLLLLSDPLPPIGRLSDYQAAMLYRLVEARYTAGRAMVTTINVAGREEADSRMGAPVWDRLKDGAWVVKCHWPSHRKPAKFLGVKGSAE